MKRTRSITALALAILISIPLVPLAYDAAAQQQPGAASPAPNQVPQPDTGVNWPGVGYGAGALFGNILYIPAKFVYAFLGTLVGGATWLCTAGNTQAADTVWRASLGGDYVLTPQMVAGEQPVNFSGPTETPPLAPPQPPEPAMSSATPPPAAAPVGSAPAASSGGGQPIDTGAGPVGGAAPSSSNIE